MSGVREVQRSWNQPCDETRARSTRRSRDLCPTVNPVAKDRRGVIRDLKRSRKEAFSLLLVANPQPCGAKVTGTQRAGAK